MRQKIPMNENEMNEIAFLFELSVSVFTGKKNTDSKPWIYL